MPGPYYVWNGAGGGATGADWTNAFLTMGAAITASVAGDTIYVASDHTETQGTTLTWTFPGTQAAPNKVLSCDRTATPPTALLAGASAIITGATSMVINGSAYIYGYDLRATSAASNGSVALLNSGAGDLHLDTCQLKLPGTNASATITLGSTSNNIMQRITLTNTQMTFASASQRILLQRTAFTWRNTSTAFVAGTLPTTTIFNTGSTVPVGFITLDGLDFSNLAAATSIIPAQSQAYIVNMNNCKMPASFTTAATPSGAGGRVFALNCSDGTQNYRQQLIDYSGTLTADTTTYRTSGASDGTTNISWKVVGNANTNRYTPFRTFEIAKWNETLTAQTVTVEIATDNVTLTDAECWIEVQVMDDASSTRTTLYTSQCGVLATPANLATSTEPWTGVPGTPVTQKITSPSFTADIKGDVRVVVCYGKASGTVYIDPEIAVA